MNGHKTFHVLVQQAKILATLSVGNTSKPIYMETRSILEQLLDNYIKNQENETILPSIEIQNH